ncbi:MAG: hypothetical protein ACTSP9_06775 [Promethearchaeota archaeon]
MQTKNIQAETLYLVPIKSLFTFPNQYIISPYVIKKGSLTCKPVNNTYILNIIISASVEGKPTTAGTANFSSIKNILTILRLIKVTLGGDKM